MSDPTPAPTTAGAMKAVLTDARFSDPGWPRRSSRQQFGALLVGHFDGRELRYAGKVGTGFDDATLRELGARLAQLRRDHSPFKEVVKVAGAVWANPELVAQIGFTEWTKAGRLRHPRFLGLRLDKRASEVVREG